jgi:hypothetical protein
VVTSGCTRAFRWFFTPCCPAGHVGRDGGWGTGAERGNAATAEQEGSELANFNPGPDTHATNLHPSRASELRPLPEPGKAGGEGESDESEEEAEDEGKPGAAINLSGHVSGRFAAEI